MKKKSIQFILATLLTCGSFSVIAQTETPNEEINGTFTIYLATTKEKPTALSEEQLLEIESLRKDTEDFETNIDDIKVLIMSREKMEANSKWPRYTLLND
jgi:hypothetical protein